jgi:hypothetical protein
MKVSLGIAAKVRMVYCGEKVVKLRYKDVKLLVIIAGK